MALTTAQSLSKLRGAARRVLRAVKAYEAAPHGLVNISACADLSQARKDIDEAQDALQGIVGRGLRRAMRRDQRNGTAGSIVALRWRTRRKRGKPA